MWVEREEEGVQLRELPILVVDTLIRLPEWLESQDPKLRARLLPRAYADEEQDREWRETLGESLEHLLLSRTEILRKDLKGLQVDSGVVSGEDLEEITFRLQIVGPHLSAWVNSLQAGTHALFILHDLQAEDLQQDLFEVEDSDRRLALLRLALLQELLVRILESPEEYGGVTGGTT